MEYKPVPNFDATNYYKGLKEKKLIFQKCNNCGHIRWPYSIACPVCYEKDFKYIESNGDGMIYTFTIFNVPFDKNFKDKVPYVVAVVQLTEGVKMVTNIIKSPLEKIKCNAPVEVIWEKCEDYFIPKFKLK
jgi:uncharacterized OB-fold protein